MTIDPTQCWSECGLSKPDVKWRGGGYVCDECHEKLERERADYAQKWNDNPSPFDPDFDDNCQWPYFCSLSPSEGLDTVPCYLDQPHGDRPAFWRGKKFYFCSEHYDMWERWVKRLAAGMANGGSAVAKALQVDAQAAIDAYA